MLGTLGFLAGVALLMAGVIVPLTIVSVVGFVVMLASAYVALTYWRRVSGPEELGSARSGSTARSSRAASSRLAGGSSTGFMDRLEERWRRRRESGF